MARNVPTYRLWRTREQGFAERNGHRVYFPGKYGSDESRKAYEDWVAKLEADERPEGLTIAELGERYLDACEATYGVGHRTASGAAGLAIRELAHSEHGSTLVGSFGPKALQAFRQSLVKRKLARATINARIAWVRRCFRWGVSQEIVPADALTALESVAGLRKGRTTAREAIKRSPVGQADVAATAAELSRDLRAALWLQWFTGARSGSIVAARGDQFGPDPADPGLVLWRPRHKTEYKEAELIVVLGPQAQAAIADTLGRARQGLLFSPQRARHNGRARQAYTATSYRRAIVRAQDRAIAKGTLKIHWTPHQLRHAKGHAIRDRYGIEAAQAVLGHEAIAATQIYSARRLDLARQVARAEG